ncbi:potassium-transporting ATPase [Cutibacterium acnes JCM 18916]|nr:potassium-transporting ATPase [Cutibacterium acnes JCM 18916]
MTWICFLAGLALLAIALGIAQHHLGTYMARVFTSDKDTRVETWCYRVMGVNPRAGQTWKSYARAVLAFSFCGVVFLYALQRLQPWLPWSLGKGSVNPAVSFNTAISFVTNTNWQAYSPEATLGHFVQLAGLCVQNFVSAATGIAIAVALIRGFVGHGEHTIGNFWVDLTRCTLRILMPIAAVAAFLLIAGGAVQNFTGFLHVTGVAGGNQVIPGGPVASQEAIKELGTNGGGFFNGNSSHPSRIRNRGRTCSRSSSSCSSRSRCLAPSGRWWKMCGRAGRYSLRWSSCSPSTYVPWPLPNFLATVLPHASREPRWRARSSASDWLSRSSSLTRRR